ncbi:Ig-like domain-containing protein [Pantoea trifolii]|uniref:Ig-like domain-containing protein n=1 Tax=Pantoea trifolii TaxID=2968030 RepID=UPI003EDB6177
MSTAYDPMLPGFENWVNTPYQYWKSNAPDAKDGIVELVINGKKFTSKIDANGDWEFQLPLQLAEGGHNLSIRYVDLAGNYGDVYQTRINVDLSAPDKPGITRIMDDVGSVKGPVGDKGFTDDRKPTISGYAEPDSIVRVYSNGFLLGSVQAAKNGQWTMEPKLRDGEQRIYVTATDRFGQVSEDSDVFTLFVNVPTINKPQLLEVYDNYGLETGIIKHGESTDDLRPSLRGNAPVGAESVHIYVKGKRVGIAPVENGKWAWEASSDVLHYGKNSITLRSQNSRGELSQPTAAFDVIAVAPTTVKIEYAWDNFGDAQGKLASGADTDDLTPAFSGSAEAHSIVYLHARHQNGSWSLKGSAVADANGFWNIEVAKLTNGNGVYDFQASNSTSYNGKSGEFSLQINTYVQPVIESAYDNNGLKQGTIQNGGRTDDLTPTLKGHASAGAIVYIHVKYESGAWWVSGSTKADAKGEWSYDMPQLPYHSNYDFQASGSTVRDPKASTFTLYAGPDAQIAPVIDYLIDNNGLKQGTIQNGGRTDDLTPTLKGHASAGAIVYIHVKYESGAWWVSGSTKADAKGEWSYDMPQLPYHSNYDFQASGSTVRDPKASTFTLYAGPDAQIAPVIDTAYDNNGKLQGTIQNGGRTDDLTPTLKGHASVGAIVYVHTKHENGNWWISGSTNANAKGEWAYDMPQLTTYGTYTFQVSGSAVRDPSSAFLSLYAAPDSRIVPVIVTAHDNNGLLQGNIVNGGRTDDLTPTLKGYTSANSTVYIHARHDNGKWWVSGSTKANANGEWTFTTPQLTSYGTHDFQVSGSTVRDPNAAMFTFDAKPDSFASKMNEISSDYLADLIAASNQKSVVNMVKISSGNTLNINVSDILSAGSKDLFIQDGKTQLVVKGNKNDVIKLDDLLGNGIDEGDWHRQKGKVSVAGLKYQVYSHDGLDVELLVQQGVKIDLI